MIIKDFLHKEDGVTAIEYGLVAALLAIAIILGVSLIGKNLHHTRSEPPSTVK